MWHLYYLQTDDQWSHAAGRPFYHFYTHDAFFTLWRAERLEPWHDWALGPWTFCARNGNNFHVESCPIFFLHLTILTLRWGIYYLVRRKFNFIIISLSMLSLSYYQFMKINVPTGVVNLLKSYDNSCQGVK